jgi:AcrR family transcriptional regulator
VADNEAVNEKLYGTVMQIATTPQTSRAGRDDKRETILKIAYEAFLAEGYAATSMSSIAAKLGGSKATLYNYFSSKQEMFIAVIDEKCQDVQAKLFDTEFERENFEDALKGLGKRFLTLLMSDDKIATYRLITASTSQFPELGRAFYQSGPAQGKKRLASFFAEAVADGKLRPGDTDMMASHFFDLCEGDIHRRRLWNVISSASDAEIENCVAHAVRVFLAAYGA